MENQESKDIELRSEEVQEVLGSVPSWILRWGITLLSSTIFILIVGSYIFKYPETISAPMVLTTKVPPVSIVAKTSGEIVKLYVKDQQNVKEGECLAILENPASYEDVCFIKTELDEVLLAVNRETTYKIGKNELKLGALQNLYSELQINLSTYNQFVSLNYYPQKIASIRHLIEANKLHFKSMLSQQEIVKKQHAIEVKIYNRESYLSKQNMISEEESDKAQSTLLQSDLAVKNMHSSLENMQIQISQMEENLVDIKQQYLDKKNTLISGLKANINQLQNEIRSWEMTYVLSSPISGRITFTNFWTVNQNVVVGDIVFSVVPRGQTQLIGKALLPIASSGKVRIGQKVNIHFNNYPDNEYGLVIGKVKRISLIPNQKGDYVIEVSFPNGLRTTYNKKLPLLQEMTAKADIITDNLRLIEQFIQPLKKILKNNL